MGRCAVPEYTYKATTHSPLSDSVCLQSELTQVPVYYRPGKGVRNSYSCCVHYALPVLGNLRKADNNKNNVRSA